jgi:hypothetical protein
VNLLRFVGHDWCALCCHFVRVCCDSCYRGHGLPFDHDDPVCQACCSVHTPLTTTEVVDLFQ